jgi:hypothetical protein
MTSILVIESAMLSGWSFVPPSGNYKVSVMTPPRSSDPASFDSLEVDREVNALVVDGRFDSSAVAFGLAALARYNPKLFVLLTHKDVTTGADFELPSGYLPNWRMNMPSESMGSPFIRTYGVHCWGDATLGVHAPRALFGPSVEGEEGSPVLWPDYFSGRGTPVSRDSGSVLDYLYAAVAGQAPLWARSGWPVLLPENPFVFRDLDREVAGILCSSVDQAGGFVVLDAVDLIRIAGIDIPLVSKLPQGVLWREVRRVITVPFATALCEWLHTTSSRFSRERAPASIS